MRGYWLVLSYYDKYKWLLIPEESDGTTVNPAKIIYEIMIEDFSQCK